MNHAVLLPSRRPDAAYAGLLRHPLWLVSLGLLLVNDHWAKTAGLLPGLVTGKLSDLVGPIVAGGALAVALRLRSRRAVQGCFAAAAGFVAAINLWPDAARAVEAATAWLAGHGLGWAWAITVDPSDVLALLPLPWLVRWLLDAVEASRAADLGVADPIAAATTGRGRALGAAPSTSLPRWAQRALLATAALASAATSEAPMPTMPEPFFLAWDAQLVLGNATDATLHVRLRWLRPELKVDCDAITETPSETLHRGLFASGRTFQLLAGRTMPLGETTNPFNLGLDPQAFAKRDCHALLIDGGTLPERLVVFKASDFPMTGVDQRTDVAKKERLVAFETDPALPSTQRWRSHSALFAPPAQQISAPPPGCALVDEAIAASDSLEGLLGTVQGAKVRQQSALPVTAVSTDAAGCTLVSVGASPGPGSGSGSGIDPFSFTVCLPEGAMPFAAGDVVSFRRQPLGQSGGVVDGYEITSKTHRVRVGRGDQPVLYGSEPWTAFPAANCGEAVGSCGEVGRAASLGITLPLDGAKPWKLKVGESIPLDAKRRLWLTQAATIVAALPGCAGGANALGPFFETVLVEELSP